MKLLSSFRNVKAGQHTHINSLISFQSAPNTVLWVDPRIKVGLIYIIKIVRL